MRGSSRALTGAIGVAALLGAVLLFARGEEGGVFVPRPAVVLPLLIGAFVCAAAAARAGRSRGAFALLGSSLAATLLCTGVALATGSGIPLAVASALRPASLGAMALIGVDLVLRRGRTAVRRIVAAATAAGALLILLFQPTDTSFGSWPALIPLPPAAFALLAPGAMVIVQAVLCAPAALAAVGWVRVVRGTLVPAHAWVATLPAAIGGLSLLLAAWSTGNHGDATAPATLTWAALGAAAASLGIATLLTRAARVVAVFGATSAAGLLLSGSTAAALLSGGTQGPGAVASAVTLGAVALGAAAAVLLRRGPTMPAVVSEPALPDPSQGTARDDPDLRASAPGRGSRQDPRLAALSTREGEILDLLATGLTNREIAERTYLSPRTVDAHLRSVFRKLDVTGEGSPRMRAVAIWRGEG